MGIAPLRRRFGIPWATEIFGPEWQTSMPFLRAMVKQKMRLSKTNDQRLSVVVEYDNSELKRDLKRDLQYLYDHVEDQAYL